jgi:hypothetical protein
MKKILLIILTVVLPFISFSQGITKEDFEKEIKPLKENLKSLQKENLSLKNEINLLKNEDEKLQQQLIEVKGQTHSIENNLNSSKGEFKIKIDSAHEDYTNKIKIVDQSLSKTSLWAIIGGLAGFILIIVIYLVITFRQKSDKSGIIDHLSKSISSIEDNLIKEFGKQTNLLEAQMEVLGRQKLEVAQNSSIEPDHSLALKVADEITLIERNISLMDTGTKGLKQLSRSVEKIRDNLSANGYDIPLLLGKPFNQGMKIVPVSTIPDERLGAGVEIITKVIKPQVNYNDKMIQAAQIEVSVGY